MTKKLLNSEPLPKPDFPKKQAKKIFPRQMVFLALCLGSVAFLGAMFGIYYSKYIQYPELDDVKYRNTNTIYYTTKFIDGHKVNTVSFHLPQTPLKNYLVKYENNALGNLNPIRSRRDAKGVPMVRIKNRNYYHPSNLMNQGVGLLRLFQSTAKEIYLQRAILYADALIQSGKLYEDKFYFEYRWWIKRGNKHIIANPWYSGIAQGQGLSFYSELYNITKIEKYLVFSNKIFSTFFSFDKSNNQPVTVEIDEGGFYWIQEYLSNQGGDYVLNGFLFAVVGLIDYYYITKDQRAITLIEASIATLKNYIDQYQVEGGVSLYSLRYKEQQVSYNIFHRKILLYFGELTGDNWFFHWAEKLTIGGKIPEKMEVEYFKVHFNQLVRGIGTIKPGDTMQMAYKNGWFYSYRSRDNIVARYSNVKYGKNHISVFGLKLKYDNSGNMFYINPRGLDVRVGYLEFQKEQKTVKKQNEIIQLIRRIMIRNEFQATFFKNRGDVKLTVKLISNKPELQIYDSKTSEIIETYIYLKFIFGYLKYNEEEYHFDGEGNLYSANGVRRGLITVP